MRYSGIFKAGAVLVLTLGFFAGASAASAQTSNLIQNPSLETANGSAPSGWESDSWGTTKATFTYPTGGAHSGSRYVKTQVTTKGTGDAKWFPASVSITPGATYTFSDWYQSTVKTEVDLEYTLSTGKLSYVELGTPAASASWKQYQVDFTAPSNAVSVRVYHLIEPKGTLSVDDYSLTEAGDTPPPPQKPAINSFTASPNAIVQGQSATLSWSVADAITLSIDQGVGAVTADSVSVSPTATTTYTLTAANSAGTTTASVTVNVSIPQTPPPPQKPVISSFTASPSSITQGQSATLSWSVANATNLSIDQGIGAVTGSSKVVSPNATTTYTLSASNSAGTTTATAVVNVAIPQTPPPPPPGNLIKNGDLESGSANSPTGWNADHWGSLTAKFAYPVAGNGGGKAAQVQVTKYSSGDAKWDFNHVAVSPDQIYDYSEDYSSNVATNVSIEYLLKDGSYDYEWVKDAPATSGWSALHIQITVPQNAVSLTVLHTLVSVGTLTIDNASLSQEAPDAFPSGMVTLSFDDGLLSQYQNALPILNAANMKGTFFIITKEPASGDEGYMTWAQIKSLDASGEEIGGHTRTHPYLTKLTATKLENQVTGSYQDLVAQGITPTSFAYPYGDVNASVEAAVKAAGYQAARGSYFGFETTATDHYDLYDIRLDTTSTLPKVEQEIDQAIADKRWLVFEIHDVLQSGGDDYTITPAFLQSIVDYLKQKNASVVTVSQGLSQLSQ